VNSFSLTVANMRSAVIAAAITLVSFTSVADGDLEPLHVKVENGAISGVREGDVIAFKGVPFAAPPVGELRWRRPQPVSNWEGILDAHDYASDCMQEPFPSDAAPLGTQPAEDCLYLNIWKPATVTTTANPVVVWIHGGGFVNGGASPAVYDGSAFARNGIVFVSINYRLGRFGFFAHPALTNASQETVANYGFLDQVAALQWVRRNIAAFGGNPNSVTLMGESAGGRSVTNLMAYPPASELFNKAIVMSGGGRGDMGKGRWLSREKEGLESAEQVGLNFAAQLGINGVDAKALSALKALPAEDICDGLTMSYLFEPLAVP